MDFPVLGTLIQVVADMGALGVSVIVIWALMTERIVPRGRVDEMRSERDRLETNADVDMDKANLRLDGLGVRLDRLTDVHEQAVQLMAEALNQRKP